MEVSDWGFRLGFRLVSDWYQTGIRLAPDGGQAGQAGQVGRSGWFRPSVLPWSVRRSVPPSSVHWSLRRSVHPSVCPSVVRRSVRLSVPMSVVRLSVVLSSVRPSVRPFGHPSVRQCPSVRRPSVVYVFQTNHMRIAQRSTAATQQGGCHSHPGVANHIL